MVNPVRVVLICGTRVLRQHFLNGLPWAACLCHLRQQVCRNAHGQTVIFGGFGKTVTGIGVAVGETEVRLDVVDGRAIQQIRAGNHNHHTLMRRFLYPQQSDAGQPDGVWAEGGTRGKHTHAGVPAKPRWTHGRMPGWHLAFVCARKVKTPQQPEVAIAVQTAHCLARAISRCEHDTCFYTRIFAALTGDAEFLCEAVVGMGDGLQFHMATGVLR